MVAQIHYDVCEQTVVKMRGNFAKGTVKDFPCHRAEFATLGPVVECWECNGGRGHLVTACQSE